MHLRKLLKTAFLAVLVAFSGSLTAAGQDAAGTGQLRPVGDVVGMHPEFDWRPTFVEEFDELSLRSGDEGRWSTVFPWGGRVLADNKEIQTYVDPGFSGAGPEPLGLNPFRVADGHLTISAWPIDKAERKHFGKARYASGLLTTFGVFAQKYGYFEMRGKVPAGKGLWPAFWLLPETRKWPPEIDVVEVIGSDPTELHMSVHTQEDGRYRGDTVTNRVADMSEGFQVFGMLWLPESITWFFNGVAQRTAPTPKDMTDPMFLLINLAVGGKWAGSPNRATRFPAEFVIDYVRAYEAVPAEGTRSQLTVTE
jgi:beta-glucanase (GH16 family)